MVKFESGEVRRGTMDELPEVYNLESIEQMRALADELRIRITDLLSQQPMTVTQLGEALGVAPGKVHYHVRELERVGLVKLVFTREKSGILEKYYTTVATKLHVPSSLLQHAPPDDVLGAINEYGQAALDGVMRAASFILRRKPDALTDKSTMLSVGGWTLWLTRQEYEQFFKQLQALMDQYSQRRGLPDEHEVVFFEAVYDAQLAGEATEGALGSSRAQLDLAAMPVPSAPPLPPAAPLPPSAPLPQAGAPSLSPE